MVGGQGYGAQLGHHKGHGDLAQVDGGALRDIGNAQVGRLPDDGPVRMKILSPFDVDLPSTVKGGAESEDTGGRKGHGRGDSGAGHAQSGPRNGDSAAQQGDGPSLVNEEEVKDDVEQVGRCVEEQRPLGVSHAPQNGGEDRYRGREGKAQGVKAQILHGIREHLRLGTQPDRDIGGQKLEHGQDGQTGGRSGQHRLPDDTAGLLRVTRPDGIGHLD